MRDNWCIAINGDLVVLVPYKRKFVEKYHNWMKDPALLEATASEPLSIEEEYDMQELWHADPKKCTFIILSTQSHPSSSDVDTCIRSSSDIELDSMVGDVNFFMNDYDDKFNAEIEIMIAEPRFKRRGLAREALKLMMYYGVTHLKLTRFFAKIGETNLASIELFKSLSFREVNYVKAFGEFEYDFLPNSDEIIPVVQEWGAHFSITPYGSGDEDIEEADEQGDNLKS